MNHKILKRLSCVILAGLMVFSLAACQKSVEIEPKDLADELYKADIYEDQLSEVDSKVALASYGMEKDDVANVYVYFSTGATPEEIAVIECSDNEGSQARVQQALNRRVTNQKTSFSDYMPDEVTKLDHAVIKCKGKYAVLCVAKDADKAKEIIKKYLS